MDNIVSQLQKVNLSEYKKIENEWATAIKKGKKVSVEVEVKYDGGGLRPVEFNVSYNIGEDFYKKTIIN